MTRLLVVEDDARIRAGLLYQLRAEGWTAEALDTAEKAWTRLSGGAGGAGEAGDPDLLLLDVRLPAMSGVDLVRRLAEAGRLPPTVVISGEASISETVEALRLGVHDFLEKPFSRERLLQSIRNALETADLRRRLAALESRLAEERELLGHSPAMARLREQIDRAAAAGGRVLVRGESGTGKELVADLLHRRGARHGGPFVKINCAAIPAPLVEDELFGHARGAFTDARAPKAGLFEEAHGGTLFLDEIGDMDPALQARLLRVVEDGRVRRLGETRDRPVDVWLIAATHRDLEAEVAAGRFRQDLYFRLARLPIEVPPLRQRGDDVRLLAEHFFERFAGVHRLRRKQVEPSIWPLLEAYAWPGNVRELRNLCERLVVLGGDPITPGELPDGFARPGPGLDVAAGGLLRLAGGAGVLPLREFRAACEREYLELVLRRTGWNFAAAARLLGLQRTYLHEKALALGLRRPSLPDPPDHST
jgi:DNA-binding NtrC family response regulator